MAALSQIYCDYFELIVLYLTQIKIDLYKNYRVGVIVVMSKYMKNDLFLIL